MTVWYNTEIVKQTSGTERGVRNKPILVNRRPIPCMVMRTTVATRRKKMNVDHCLTLYTKINTR